MLGLAKSALAEKNILKELVKITEQEVVYTRFYSSVNLTQNAIKEYGKAELVVSGIGHVNPSYEQEKVSFTIDLVDVNQKENSAVVKRLLITQDLTEEIKANPFKAYESYVQNYKNCQIEEITVGQTKLLEKDNYSVYVPEDLFTM